MRRSAIWGFVAWGMSSGWRQLQNSVGDRGQIRGRGQQLRLRASGRTPRSGCAGAPPTRGTPSRRPAGAAPARGSRPCSAHRRRARRGTAPAEWRRRWSAARTSSRIARCARSQQHRLNPTGQLWRWAHGGGTHVLRRVNWKKVLYQTARRNRDEATRRGRCLLPALLQMY